MRQTVTFFVAAAAMMLAITGCKGKGAVADDPKAVVMAFFERMANKDIDGTANIGTTARLLSQTLPRLSNVARKYDVTIIFINQINS